MTVRLADLFGTPSDMADLVSRIVDDGWEVSKTGGGHWKAQHPHGLGPVFLPSTASDYRSVRNALAELQRHSPEARLRQEAEERRAREQAEAESQDEREERERREAEIRAVRQAKREAARRHEQEVLAANAAAAAQTQEDDRQEIEMTQTDEKPPHTAIHLDYDEVVRALSVLGEPCSVKDLITIMGGDPDYYVDYQRMQAALQYLLKTQRAERVGRGVYQALPTEVAPEQEIEQEVEAVEHEVTVTIPEPEPEPEPETQVEAPGCWVEQATLPDGRMVLTAPDGSSWLASAL